MAAVTFPHPTAALVDADRRIMREWLLALQSVTTELQSEADALAALTAAVAAAQPQIKRLTTQFDKTNDTTLANITQLAATVAAATPYVFRAVLFTTLDGAGGGKIALAGTATASNFRTYQTAAADGANTVILVDQILTLGFSASSVTGNTSVMWTIDGSIVVNASGTLVPQFAQAAFAGTSSVNVGSYFQVWPLT